MRPFIRWLGGGALAACALAGAAYFVAFHFDVTEPAQPALRESLRTQSLTIDGTRRSFLYAVPEGRAKHPALILIFHGGRETPEQMRAYTGYEFEELAARAGDVVAYLRGTGEHWNTCQKGRTTAATLNDSRDVEFVDSVINWFEANLSVDASRVFAVGFSNGGHMVYRLAIELPEKIAKFAAISANQPTGEDSKCPRTSRAVSLMIVNGTEDPINPYDGGELSARGLVRMGPVLSTHATAMQFVPKGSDLGKVAVRRYPERDGDPNTWADEQTWSVGAAHQLAVLTIHGGGHSIPQRRYRFPLFFGNTSTEVDAPGEIWRFFQGDPRSANNR